MLGLTLLVLGLFALGIGILGFLVSFVTDFEGVKAPCVVMLVLALLCAPLAKGAIAGYGPHYGEGDRAGVVVRLAQKGAFTKSWEGTMTLSGAGAGLAVSEFDFSTRDPAMAAQLEAALQSGKPVVIHYDQFAWAPVTVDSDHIVKSVAGRVQ